RLGVDAAILFADITTPLTGLGVEYRIEDGVGPVVARPIRTAADVAALRPFDAETAVPGLLAAVRLIRAASPVPLIGFAGAPFTLACYLVEGRPSRDFLRVKSMLHADPGLFAALIDRLVEMTVAYLQAQVEAGAQAVQVFDSWVGGLSPFDYRIAVQPHMRRLFRSLAGLDVPTIHFGTATGGLLSLMAEAGGEVIGVDWRIALADAWALVPDRAVQGNLDPALLLGPFSAVEEQARWILDQAAGRVGHIFNLGHGVLPATDPDDLRRLVDVVHEAARRPEPSLVLERTAP
nr:uroporphyrinogen decarboxylase [Chloroflexota bacterium]